MKSFFGSFLVLSFILFFSVPASAQVFNGVWNCDYATIDDQPNATGYNTPSVGVIKPNTFVALVRRGTNSTNYLVGYTNADSLNGRMGAYGYGSGVAGYRQVWASGFDNVEMLEAMDIAATPDSLIFVASNDAERNILVFKMSADSVVSTDYRMVSGADSVYGIDVDAKKRVYITQTGSSTTTGKIRVFKSIADDPEWAGQHNSAPLTIINIPEPGEIRGVAVNPEGTIVYASNYTNKKVYCFTGSPTTGYTLYNGFNFTLTDNPIHSNGTDTIKPGPWGLSYMKEKNLLMLCVASNFTPVGYEFSRIYFLNPNNGAILDTLDAAAWNYAMTGSYSTRGSGGLQGNASGYASLYNCDYDQNFSVYSVSYYGWTVDKWTFSGTLPVIPVTILGVEKNNDVLPSEFTLSQNYPNPFNPTTTIEFSVTENALVTLNIYDINGQLVSELINTSSLEKGNYKVKFDASKLASGTYIYSLKVGDVQLTKKMTLMK